jgi:hypothetical protein
MFLRYAKTFVLIYSDISVYQQYDIPDQSF